MMTKRDRTNGITLLEILIVLAIIALIASLAAPRLMESFGRAKQQAAEVQLVNIQSALQLYYLDVGAYPSSSEGLGALLDAPVTSDGWSGPYATEDTLLDPWGRLWIYVFPAADGGFELSTLGRDGQPGGTNEDKDISR